MNEQKASSPSSIEWTRVWGRRGFTWNPIGGCQHACRWKMPDGTIARCYAEEVAQKFTGGYPHGFEHHYWRPKTLNEPLNLKDPAGIFMDSMSDAMGHWVPKEQIDEVLSVCGLADHHIFQLLTKNAPRLLKFEFPRNVWVGVSAPPTFFMGKELSVHQQVKMLQTSLRVLKQVDVPVRWMSIEPLSFDIAPFMRDCGLQWVVIGAASNGRRKYQPDSVWVAHLLKVMDEQGIPVFFKGNLRGNPGIDRWREDFPPEPVKVNPISSKVLASPLWKDDWAMPKDGDIELSEEDSVPVFVRGPEIKRGWAEGFPQAYAARLVRIPTLEKSRQTILSLLDQRIMRGIAELEVENAELKTENQSLKRQLTAMESSRDTWRKAYAVECRRPVDLKTASLAFRVNQLEEELEAYRRQEAEREAAKARLQDWHIVPAGQGVETKLAGFQEQSAARIADHMDGLRPGWRQRNGFGGKDD